MTLRTTTLALMTGVAATWLLAAPVIAQDVPPTDAAPAIDMPTNLPPVNVPPAPPPAAKKANNANNANANNAKANNQKANNAKNNNAKNNNAKNNNAKNNNAKNNNANNANNAKANNQKANKQANANANKKAAAKTAQKTAPAPASNNAEVTSLTVPINRATLLSLQQPMAEVMVANPDIADVHAHNATHLSIVGKKLGQTNIRMFGQDGKVLRTVEVTVGYDLPGIRQALKNFLPDENIGVERVNNGIALTGQISSAAVADKAIRITKSFLEQDDKSAPPGGDSGGGLLAMMASTTSASAGGSSGSTGGAPQKDAADGKILNFMQVTSGQQVMLRVRVGEINRTALKNLGIDLNAISQGKGLTGIGFGTGTGIGALMTDGTPGVFVLPSGDTSQGVLTGRWQPNGPNGNTYAGLIKALEQDGLFKVLAEPNLVAVSGEEAEFLSGGEIPIPVAQTGNGPTSTVTIEFKPFGVAVKFTPYVLAENRIRMMVKPEVSEISTDNKLEISGFTIPSIDTRRAKTTVELAPGESFMIAGLISDQTKASINQLPGLKELPVLGALFRSTEFQRSETELVIAVTPYIVDPMKSGDVKLPTDNFRPASQMEQFFYGALGSLSGNAPAISQSPRMEGPIGFMVD